MPKNQPVPADVKKQILERIKQEGASVPQIATEHGISAKTIYNWLGKGATAQPTWTEYNKLKRDNQTLLEIIGRLTFENTVAEKKEVGK